MLALFSEHEAHFFCLGTKAYTYTSKAYTSCAIEYLGMLCDLKRANPSYYFVIGKIYEHREKIKHGEQQDNNFCWFVDTPLCAEGLILNV